jgi:hypothetical protein
MADGGGSVMCEGKRRSPFIPAVRWRGGSRIRHDDDVVWHGARHGTSTTAEGRCAAAQMPNGVRRRRRPAGTRAARGTDQGVFLRSAQSLRHGARSMVVDPHWCACTTGYGSGPTWPGARAARRRRALSRSSSRTNRSSTVWLLFSQNSSTEVDQKTYRKVVDLLTLYNF